MPGEDFLEIECPGCHAVRAVFPDDKEPIQCYSCGTPLDRAQARTPQRGVPSTKGNMKPTGKVWERLGGVLGFLVALMATMAAFATLSKFGIDVMHIYIIEPTPPPGGYHSVFDAPSSDWPMFLAFSIGALGAKAGAALGRRIRRSAN